MATIYVRSTDGNNADTGATWALAKADITGAAAIDAAGDTIWVSDNHAESTAANLTFSLNGSVTAPTRLLCGDDAAEPPTALATSATVTANITGSNITISGYVYGYGITFVSGTSTGNPVITLNSGATQIQIYENCNFQLAGTGGGGVIRPIAAGQASNRTEWRNCGIKFAAAGQGIQMNGGEFRWIGGSLQSGGTSPTALISATNVGAATASGVAAVIEGIDLTNASSTINLCTNSLSAGTRIIFRNMKMPASWSGTPNSGTLNAGCRIELYNYDGNNYSLWIEDGQGSIKHETILVRTNGVSDGATGLSWKMVSAANAAFPVAILYSPEFAIWSDITGSPVTVTVEILRDSATNLKDNEIWLELRYLGTSLSTLSSFITDRVDLVTTAADQATSSATWTTTGMANPNKQALSVTFTPQVKGFYICQVALAKPSTTVYVDYLPTLT